MGHSVKWFYSLRGQLFLLIIIAALPPLALTFDYAYREYRAIRKDSLENTAAFAKLAAQYQSGLIEGTKEFLYGLSLTPIVQNSLWTECNGFLSRALQENKRYSNLGVVSLDGDIKCSAVPLRAPINIADRSYVTGSLTSRKFSVGEFHIGRVSNIASIGMAVPLINAKGEIKGAVFSAIDLTTLKNTAREIALPQNSILIMFDRKKNRLVYSGDSRNIEDVTQEAIRIIQKGARLSSAAEVKIDDGDYIFGWSSINGVNDDKALTIFIANPINQALASSKSHFFKVAGLILLTSLILFGIAIFGAHIFVIKKVHQLISATKRIGSGDFTFRINESVQGGELGSLAKNIDQMSMEIDRYFDQSTRITSELESQNRLLAIIAKRCTDLPEVLEQLALLIEKRIPIARCAILVSKALGGIDEGVVAPSLPPGYGALLAQLEMQEPDWPCARSISKNDIVSHPNIQHERNLAGYLAVASNYDIRAVIASPILSSDGLPLGALVLYYRHPQTGFENVDPLLRTAANLAAIAIESSQNHQALTTSEKEYRFLFEHNPNPMWIFDEHSFQFLAVNDQAIEHYGFSREEFLSMRIVNLLSEDEYERMYEVLNSKGRYPELSASEHRKKNGEIIHVESSTHPIIFQSKNARIASMKDVTVEKQAKGLLAKRDYQFRSLLESTAEAICCVDVEGRCIFANRSFGSLFGFDNHEVLRGQFLQDFFIESPRRTPLTRHLSILEAAQSGERVHVEDESIELKNGWTIPVEYWSHPLYKDDKLDGAVITFIDISERKAHLQALEYQANHDSLTGLANRLYLHKHLQNHISHRKTDPFALLLMDLDGFKEINDTLGHQAGDVLLKKIAERLKQRSENTDLIVRLGGDEFAIFLADINSEHMLQTPIKKIAETIEIPFELEGVLIKMRASIGAVIYPIDANTSGTLLKLADIAMYQAKTHGWGYAVYQPSMNIQTTEKLALMSDLHQALDRDEFVLHYQPKINIRSADVVGVEALLRWQHPTQGLIFPNQFINLAEMSPLIRRLTLWVIEKALKQCAEWHAQGLTISVSVNASARNLLDSDFPSRIASLLQQYIVEPGCLEIEITESVLMSDFERSRQIIAQIQQLGVSVAIDDFGTGYSSLSYLSRFPINSIKIDKSFIQGVTSDPAMAALVRSILSMCHEMKLGHVAEGVETEGQLGYLVRSGCDQVQGYIFSRPLPAQECTNFIKDFEMPPSVNIESNEYERSLLLVDDEANILTSLKRLLRNEDYKIYTAESGREGLEIMARYPVGVVISDQRMPEMTGVEFLGKVKSLYPDTVRIVLSGYTELKSVTDAINQGAIYKFLTKPWDTDQLREQVKEAFHRYELKRENMRLAHELELVNRDLSQMNRDLEMKVAENTITIDNNINVLQVSQEILEYLPVAVIGIDDEGLVVISNRQADNWLAAKDKGSLLGFNADECLPLELLDLLSDTSSESSSRISLMEGGCFNVVRHRMGDMCRTQGSILVLSPLLSIN